MKCLTLQQIVHKMSLWPWPLTFWSQNIDVSFFLIPSSVYEVWSLYVENFVTFRATRQLGKKIFFWARKKDDTDACEHNMKPNYSTDETVEQMARTGWNNEINELCNKETAWNNTEFTFNKIKLSLHSCLAHQLTQRIIEVDSSS